MKDLEKGQIGVEVGHSDSTSQHNAQANVHYTKNKKVIFWLYLLLAVCAIAANIYLILGNWNQMRAFSQSDAYYFGNQVTVQWQTGFVDDLLVTNSASCPSGYEHAFQFTWSGTGFGCYCEADKNHTFVLEGYCSPALIQSNCTNVGSQAERNAYYWKNGSNICLRRSSVSFATEEKYNGTNKICGSSKALVIMPQNSPCPLVNLTFSLPTLQDHYSTVSDTNNLLNALYATFNATSPYSFYSYPISKFAVSEYQFCQIDEDSGVHPSHSEFVLLDIVRGCQVEGNYSQLDSIQQTQFYQNNANLNQLTNILGFPKAGTWQYLLGFASLPSWTYQCRHLYDNKFSMSNAIYILNFDYYPIYNGIAIAQLIAVIVLCLQVFVLAVRRAFKKQVYPVGFRQVYLPCDFCIALTRYIIDFVCKIVLLSLVLYVTWKSYEYWNWFKAAINEDCANGNRQMTQYIIAPYTQLYEYSLRYSLGQLAVFLIIIVADIIHFCYIYNNQLSYYLIHSELSPLVREDTKEYDDFIKEKDQIKGREEKMLAIEDVAEEEAKTEQMRVTMNVFENQSREDHGQVKIKKLKKKKRFGGLKKEVEQFEQENQALKDDFNPYNLDDPSIVALNSRDSLVSPPKKKKQEEQRDEEEIVRNRKKGRGRGRGRK